MVNRKYIIISIMLISLSLLLLGVGDFTIWDKVFNAISAGLDAVVNSTINPGNPKSVIMVLFNMLPIVGNNPMSEDTFLYIVAAFGGVVSYYRWFA